ncbi:MAG: TIGR04086 family membrane protein [Ruminococcaceae bacterium]|nr:TIGR04086 family membrane protein [Oscillospiraceae bacterium]
MKKKKLAIKKSPIYTLTFSVLSGLAALFMLVIIFAVLLTKNDIPTEKLMYFWFIISVISGFISGIVSGRTAKSKSVIFGTVSALILSSISVGLLTVFADFSPDAIIILLIPLSVISGFFGALLSSNIRK